MKAICLREIRSFLSSIIGYLVISVFLLISGLLLWFIDGNYNILQSGFADLSPFFFIAPWVLIFLIPAVTMRSFSEEIRQGTIELLLTKPISIWEIVLGKFFGVLILVLIAIMPTLVYVYIITDYIAPGQTFDMGAIIGSYFGLVFLASSYSAIGIFTSSITESQIVSFILGVVLCVFFSIGIEYLAVYLQSSFIEKLGVQYHFKSISRGVIDTRDLIYFLTITIAFLSLAVYKIKMLRK
ncbi:gliding motility-associated ABC transporter permease subunit GldF [Myroides injenensis]|uniref:gliding motility-associated ABC transporter permease subunit GldF n=1 Tax=Myroides injenensis TaxID=1183151 RepID=UPI00028A2B1C|nr:gliding motility-associated ABC transporter permease subunit GldF [Myroides injenensis]